MAQIKWEDPLSLWQKQLIDSIITNSTPLIRQLYQPNHIIKYFSADSMPAKIHGLKADCIILDDLLNEGARNMKEKPIKKDYNTVGVRFLYGHNLAKVYTYRVRKGAKLHLGQEVIVPSHINAYDPARDSKIEQNIKSVAVVVEIHKTPQDTGPYNYLHIEGTIKPL